MKQLEVDYVRAYRQCMHVTLHNMKLGRQYDWSEVCRVEMENIEMLAGEKEAIYRKHHKLGNDDYDDFKMMHNPRVLFYDNI